MNAIAHALPTTASTGALTIRGLNKAYPLKGKQVPVLEGIDLDIRPGEFVSIVGASGCGKSTLLRLIVGLDQDYQGQILLDRQPVHGPGLERGIVFQDHRLFPWMTLQQNIALALKNHALPAVEKNRLVAEHIELVGLSGYEQAYPHQLSGGMAQRAAIARALVNKPKVLLLDEPLGALDALTRVRLQQELQRIWVQERCTVIMVTHDIEEALYLGDRVIVMDAHPGRIREDLRIDLPHPRQRDSQVLQGYKQRLLGELVGH
ncbi:ABC transporter ATP-binding protein [Pseudomonas putida]|uniref:ABC transporter ATP-binding protein n=1 Tax=Pseudomonas putida TaxID=303 RepID=UPI00383A6F4C